MKVHITEMDVSCPDPCGEAELAAQAEVYASMLRACRELRFLPNTHKTCLGLDFLSGCFAYSRQQGSLHVLRVVGVHGRCHVAERTALPGEGLPPAPVRRGLQTKASGARHAEGAPAGRRREQLDADGVVFTVYTMECPPRAKGNLAALPKDMGERGETPGQSAAWRRREQGNSARIQV